MDLLAEREIEEARKILDPVTPMLSLREQPLF